MQETGQQKLLSANITAYDHNEVMARCVHISSTFRPMAENRTLNQHTVHAGQAYWESDDPGLQETVMNRWSIHDGRVVEEGEANAFHHNSYKGARGLIVTLSAERRRATSRSAECDEMTPLTIKLQKPNGYGNYPHNQQQQRYKSGCAIQAGSGRCMPRTHTSRGGVILYRLRCMTFDPAPAGSSRTCP